MIEAMIFRARTGCPWRDLPEIFGPWKSVYTRWRRWSHLGLWDAVLCWLEPCAEGQLRHLDATHIKLHQDGANPAGGQHLQAIGRTKGGLNTKLTALVDSRGRALQVRLNPGQRSDFQIAEAIAPSAGKRVIADKGYDSDKLRTHFARGGAQTGIAPRATRSGRVPFHRGGYRLRHRVENFFQRMKRFRGIAKRYEKLSIHFLSAVQLVAVLEWISFRV
jgi:transposase